jgi:hypothetical protein
MLTTDRKIQADMLSLISISKFDPMRELWEDCSTYGLLGLLEPNSTSEPPSLEISVFLDEYGGQNCQYMPKPMEAKVTPEGEQKGEDRGDIRQE